MYKKYKKFKYQLGGIPSDNTRTTTPAGIPFNIRDLAAAKGQVALPVINGYPTINLPLFDVSIPINKTPYGMRRENPKYSKVKEIESKYGMDAARNYLYSTQLSDLADKIGSIYSDVLITAGTADIPFSKVFRGRTPLESPIMFTTEHPTLIQQQRLLNPAIEKKFINQTIDDPTRELYALRDRVNRVYNRTNISTSKRAGVPRTKAGYSEGSFDPGTILMDGVMPTRNEGVISSFHPSTSAEKALIEAHEKTHGVINSFSDEMKRDLRNATTTGKIGNYPEHKYELELTARMAQFKNALGLKGNESFTKAQMDFLRDNYAKNVLDNNITDLFNVIPKGSQQEINFINNMNKYAFGMLGIGAGTAAMNKKQQGGSFFDKLRIAGSTFGTTDIDHALNSLNLLANMVSTAKLNNENNQYQKYWERQMGIPSMITNPQAYGNPYAMQRGGIHIDPENKGKFTRWAKNHGMSVSEAANKVMSAPEGKYSPSVRKMANFARNARKFKHQDGGEICWECMQDYSNPLAYPIEMRVGGSLIGFKPMQDSVIGHMQAGGTMEDALWDTNASYEQQRLARLIALSKQYGVRTQDILTRPAKNYTSPGQPIDYRYIDYDFIDPETKKPVTHRQHFDTKRIGYSTGAYQKKYGGVTARTKKQQEGGYFMYPNASSIHFPGSGERQFVPGPFPLVVQDNNGLQFLSNTPINTYGPVTEYPMFKYGGQVNYTAKEVSTEDATIEGEKGEYILGSGMAKNPFKEDDSNIGVGLYRINGNKHYNGGTKLAANPGDFIFSDDKHLSFSKEMTKDIIGKDINKVKLRTPAKLAGVYNNLNKFIDMAQDSKSTNIDRKTALLNTENILDKLADIAIGQEALKGFPTGIPDFARASLEKRGVASSPLGDDAQEQPPLFQSGGTFRSVGYDTDRTRPEDFYYISPYGNAPDQVGYVEMKLPNGFNYPFSNQSTSPSAQQPGILQRLNGPYTQVNQGEYYTVSGSPLQRAPNRTVFSHNRSNPTGFYKPFAQFQAPAGFYNNNQPWYFWDRYKNMNPGEPAPASDWRFWDRYGLDPLTFPELERGTPVQVGTKTMEQTQTRTNGSAPTYVPRPIPLPNAVSSLNDIDAPFDYPNVPLILPNGATSRSIQPQKDPIISSRNYNNTVNPNIAELYGLLAANKRYPNRYPTAQRNFELDNVDALLTSAYRPLSAQPYLNNIQRQLNTFTSNNSGYGPVSYARNSYAFTQGLNAQQQAIGQVEQQNIQRQDQLSQSLAQNAINRGQSRLQLQDKYLRELEQVRFNQENASKARMAQNAQLLNAYVNRANTQKYANAMLDNFQFDANGNIIPVPRNLRNAVLDSPAGNQMSSQLNYMEQLFRLMNRYGIRNGNFVDDFVKPITGAR